MTASNSVHCDIRERLGERLAQNSVPHMIFHGPSGGGKRTLVNGFIRQIYGNQASVIKEYVLYADCAHGKGIKFIRDQVKFFAKTNLRTHSGAPFKTIVLTNADKLTTDAQSALRRIIEVFSRSTRFFVVVEEKFRLMLPILSRLSDVYVPLPVIGENETNLNKLTVSSVLETASVGEDLLRSHKTTPGKRIGAVIRKHVNCGDADDDGNEQTLDAQGSVYTLAALTAAANDCYQMGLCGDDVIKYVEMKAKPEERSRLVLSFDKMRSSYRCEPMFMAMVLYNGLVRSNQDFVNVGFM